jgi:hypothetical protein
MAVIVMPAGLFKSISLPGMPAHAACRSQRSAPIMSKKLLCTIALLSLVGAAGIASAESTMLMDSQMDEVSAGISPPTTSQMASIGALAWATSSVTTAPGAAAVIDAKFKVQVGLAGNGASFTPVFYVVRPGT